MSKQVISLGPWLWGPRIDLAAFGGSAALALALVGLGHWLGFGGGDLPEWGWVAFVLLVDVAHVYSTLFRTYFDAYEVRRHRVRYWGLPLALYLGGVLLYRAGDLWFWRVLAYVAVFHFIRQQVGWTALYRARAKQSLADKWIDDGAIYASTLFPVIYWHANLDVTRFNWFVEGDFVSLAVAATLEPWAWGVWIFSLVLFVGRQAWHLVHRQELHLGKLIVVLSTAAIWSVGIVFTNSDFDFTVTNVIVHGVPYMVLLWAYSKARATQAEPTLTRNIAAAGVGMFLLVLLLLAYSEEWAWNHLVYREHDWLFPGAALASSEAWKAWLVPLLALPQVTHYALDGVLWRRRDTAQSAAQRVALGFS